MCIWIILKLKSINLWCFKAKSCYLSLTNIRLLTCLMCSVIHIKEYVISLYRELSVTFILTEHRLFEFKQGLAFCVDFLSMYARLILCFYTFLMIMDVVKKATIASLYFRNRLRVYPVEHIISSFHIYRLAYQDTTSRLLKGWVMYIIYIMIKKVYLCWLHDSVS